MEKSIHFINWARLEAAQLINQIKVFPKNKASYRLSLSYSEFFYQTIYHGYWKYKAWNMFNYILFEFKYSKFVTCLNGLFLNTTF